MHKKWLMWLTLLDWDTMLSLVWFEFQQYTIQMPLYEHRLKLTSAESWAQHSHWIQIKPKVFNSLVWAFTIWMFKRPIKRKSQHLKVGINGWYFVVLVCFTSAAILFSKEQFSRKKPCKQNLCHRSLSICFPTLCLWIQKKSPCRRNNVEWEEGRSSIITKSFFSLLSVPHPFTFFIDFLPFQLFLVLSFPQQQKFIDQLFTQPT